MYLISVVMPTYNRANLLDLSVLSVLNQTLSDFELLIVDDGSTDHTRDKVLSFHDKRIKYVYKTNSGVAAARNVGLNVAQGEYIAFLDDDDCWPNNYLEKMVNLLQRSSEYGLVYCRYKIITGGKVVKMTDSNLCRSGHMTVNLFRNSFILPSTCLIAKHALGEIRFDEALENAEDSDFFLRLSLNTKYLFMDGIIVEKNETPRSLANIVSCNRIRSLERFFFRIDQQNRIPLKTAKKKLSKSYRQTAKSYHKLKNYRAANYLLLQAINYNPYRWNLYFEYGYVKLLSFFNDSDWRHPEPLSMPVMSVCKLNA